MAKTIETAKSGDKTNKLWQKLNEVIGAINALTNLEVRFTDPGSSSATAHEGKVLFSQSNATLNLKLKSGIPPPPNTDTYVLGAVDGVVQWLATTACAEP